MGQPEVTRRHVLKLVLAGRLTLRPAAERPGPSSRQGTALKAAVTRDGAAADGRRGAGTAAAPRGRCRRGPASEAGGSGRPPQDHKPTARSGGVSIRTGLGPDRRAASRRLPRCRRRAEFAGDGERPARADARQARVRPNGATGRVVFTASRCARRSPRAGERSPRVVPAGKG